MALTVSPSKQALSAILSAAAALDGVTVAIGLPMDENALAAVSPEAVFLLDLRDWRRTPAGQGIRDETYTLPLRVRVYRAGADRDGIETRLEAIVDAVDDAIRADDELSGTVRHAELVSATAITGTSDSGNGLLAFADLGVSCSARTVVR